MVSETILVGVQVKVNEPLTFEGVFVDKKKKNLATYGLKLKCVHVVLIEIYVVVGKICKPVA